MPVTLHLRWLQGTWLRVESEVPIMHFPNSDSPDSSSSRYLAYKLFQVAYCHYCCHGQQTSSWSGKSSPTGKVLGSHGGKLLCLKRPAPRDWDLSGQSAKILWFDCDLPRTEQPVWHLRVHWVVCHEPATLQLEGPGGVACRLGSSIIKTASSKKGRVPFRVAS